MKLKLLLLTLLLPLLTPSVFAAKEVRITIDAPENKIEVGETFHITIEAENCEGKINVPEMPKGVIVAYHTSQSSSSQTIQNGKSIVRNTTSLIMTCKGKEPGKYKFGPVSIDGKTSNTISYQVIPATPGRKSGGGASANPGNLPDTNAGPLFIGNGNEEMFLKAAVNKTTAYEQEAIEYTVKLYTTYGDIKFLGAAAAPKFDGFVVEESPDVSKSFVFEDYGGKTYKTAIIARYIIFPQKSGKLKVEGNTYTVSTDAKTYYHDPYFQTLTVKRPIQLNVTPNNVDIDVKPLPAPVPDNFIGGVGTFSIRTSMPVTSLSTNTPASLVYVINGTGNIKYVKLPDLKPYFPNSIEVYTPEVKSEVKAGRSNVSGYSEFDYSIVALEAGNFTLPAVELTYFDPQDGEYKKLHTDRINLTVAMGKSSARSQQTMTFNPTLLPEGNPTLKDSRPYVYTWYYWLWYGIPLILFGLSLGMYRKYLREHEDLTALRSKKANKMALKRLAKAYQCFKNHQDSQFYDEMLAALWGYIGDKLKMPTSELNRSNVGEEFRKHGVKEDTFMPIINLIDECEYAKYTPVSRDANMRQLYYDALDSLAKVESEYDKNTPSHDDENDTEDDE